MEKNRSSYKKLFSNTLIIAFGSFSSKLLMLLLVSIYTRYLSEAELGVNDVIQQISNWLLPVVTMQICEAVMRFGLDRHTDNVRVFTVGNAVLTAEGAVGLLIRESPRSLWKGKALVTGWGRIARQLAPRLRALDCETWVAARKAGDRAEAEGYGLCACTFEELPKMAGEMDFLVNTVPAPVIPREVLERLRPDAVLLELASEASFDKALAEELGLRTVFAPGLPGRSAPCAAACLMRDTIYAVIREREENDGQ